jgi:PadR family transcriptional regulator, regulatory protein PadR
MSQLNKELLKGSSTTVILTILNQKEMYGYELMKAIEKESNGAFAYKEGTLYPVLHQLEKQGAIQSRWEDTESARKRKFYRITPKGKKLLVEKKEEWMAFRAAIDQLITGLIPETA